MKAEKKLVGIAWVSERLELSRSTIYRMVEAGEIPAVRIGGAIRFDPEQVEAWLEHELNRSWGR